MITFVVPNPQTTPFVSGGNVYNLGLTAALREAGIDIQLVDLDAAKPLLRAGSAGLVIVDSLYLAQLPWLASSRSDGAPLYLLTHYLPSLVAHGSVPAPSELSSEERAALAVADGFLVPSHFMAGALAQLGAGGRPTLVISPALPQLAEQEHPTARSPIRAVLVANLVPGKGVLPFLERLRPTGARFELTVIGSTVADPAYAEDCRRSATRPSLEGAVQLAGVLSHTETLTLLQASDLLVSASRMESFGLALAEARALGVPIVARAGGNVAAHVDEAAGGRLCTSDEELAAELVHLARHPAELDRRRRAARAARPLPRTWADAAQELRAALSASVKIRDRASE